MGRPGRGRTQARGGGAGADRGRDGAAVATGFDIGRETLRRWVRAAQSAGTAGLVPERRGPRGPSKLTPAVVAEIGTRRAGGASLRAVASAVGVSTDSVRRALAEGAGGGEAGVGPGAAGARVEAVPVVLAEPEPRVGERAAARAHVIEAADPVFAPAARVPLAGLLLALPALAATGLLSCAREVYGKLPAGFYGLETTEVVKVYEASALLCGLFVGRVRVLLGRLVVFIVGLVDPGRCG
ncbi:helix-turn-helix domain-containing protein [Pseudactinotalea sp. HY158]|uniref:helix-turn-helix domain-containing protein n=1 Tax=Pseudactinotalea sp. HY158 TaxID=2654547 RepID=UPI00129C1486|nr:helix-turn-helix domain-containing protein [Pseudactinotalea sp. HY158]QGH70254.1 helix-turn-helix domain-containing protein [Pseudactinotalea sp. HY158]